MLVKDTKTFVNFYYCPVNICSVVGFWFFTWPRTKGAKTDSVTYSGHLVGFLLLFADEEPQKPTFEKQPLKWEEDAQLYSHFLDRKVTTVESTCEVVYDSFLTWITVGQRPYLLAAGQGREHVFISSTVIHLSLVFLRLMLSSILLCHLFHFSFPLGECKMTLILFSRSQYDLQRSLVCSDEVIMT